MRRVKWGVLGCANFARKRTIPALLETPSAELVGVASRDGKKAESFAAEFGIPQTYAGYEALLDDSEIEAVYIPLPNGLHAEWTIRCLQKKKHVVCEKPFAADAAEAARVAEIARNAGAFASEAFMWRHHTQHRTTRAAIAGGEIGSVELVRASFTFPLPRKPNVRLEPSLAGGSLMDVGCYPVSAARYYFGREPRRVYAVADIDPEYEVDMRMSGILEFEAGRALFDCGFNLPYRTHLEIAGAKGTITVPRPWLPDPEATLFINEQPRRLPTENQYVNQFEQFSNCIRTGTAPEYGPEDAVLQMRVIDALYRSMKSGARENV